MEQPRRRRGSRSRAGRHASQGRAPPSATAATRYSDAERAERRPAGASAGPGAACTSSIFRIVSRSPPTTGRIGTPRRVVALVQQRERPEVRRRPVEDDQEEQDRRQSRCRPVAGRPADERRKRARGAADHDVLRRPALEPARVDEDVEVVADEREHRGEHVRRVREQRERERRRAPAPNPSAARRRDPSRRDGPRPRARPSAGRCRGRGRGSAAAAPPHASASPTERRGDAAGLGTPPARRTSRTRRSEQQRHDARLRQGT